MLRPYNRPGQWELLVGGGEGFVGGAEEGGGFVEDDGDGDVAEEAFEFPLVLEGVEENSVFHFFENFDGDAAGDVDAAERQNFQREISGFGAVDGGPEIQGVGTHAAGLVQATAGDLRGGIRVGIFKRRVDDFRIKEFVNGAEAATGKNEFPAYLRIAAAHEAQEFDLLLGVRGEVGVAAFGRHNAVAAAVPFQDRLAKTSTCGNQCARSARLGLAWIQDAEIFRRKMLDAVARGAKVIQENNVRDTQLFDEAGGVDDPWKICRSHGAVDHRPGNAKASGNDAFLAQMIGRLAREFLDDAFELGELLACEALFEHGRERAAFFREKRQITLRPANVPCKDHLSPYPGLYLYFTSGAAI